MNGQFSFFNQCYDGPKLHTAGGRFNEHIKMDRCYITGIREGSGHRIERHHVFGAANRTRSTFYGFVVPLVAEIHPNGAAASDKECQALTGMSLKELDLKLKQECQEYYEKVLKKSREQFIEEFGRNCL